MENVVVKNSKILMGNSEAMLEQFATDQSTTSSKKVESGPRWTDENIRRLIQLWSEKPALYDTKHDSYFSKNKRREALDKIIEEMDMSEKDIQQKMVSLRTYYGSQQRKKIAWESDPTKTTPFKSRWQFWIPLDFLQDHMTQKQSDTKMQVPLDEECLSPEFCEDSTPEKELPNFSMIQVPATKVSKRSFEKIEKPLELSEHDEHFVEKRRKRQEKEELPQQKTDDELFLEVILKSLSKIDEGEAKEALKIEIQNLVFRTRFGSHRQLLTSNMMQTQPCFSGSYQQYGTTQYQGNNDLGNYSHNGSDDEPSMTSRRKASNPKRSAHNGQGKVKDNYNILTMAHGFTGQEPSEM